MRDYNDVEIYVRRPHETKADSEEYIWFASYESMAQFTSQTIVDLFEPESLDEGPWEIGIRERGDEQYSQQFRVTPLEDSRDETYEAKNRVAALLNHWRQ